MGKEKKTYTHISLQRKLTEVQPINNQIALAVSPYKYKRRAFKHLLLAFQKTKALTSAQKLKKALKSYYAKLWRCATRAQRSRSQRLGLGKKSGDAILLRGQELGSDGRYQDVPVEEGRRGRARERTGSADLGSLVESPTENRTNYFRDEIRRQEHQR
ncbi:hypothetical protein BDZ45DRAFT_688779 [Acephala macrosclerotiorum]|nr:hypothetical protein BDZ45DRAFT_688779 [Acephala macrosclerotiorum]